MKKNILFLGPMAVIMLAVLASGLSSLSDTRFSGLQWVAAICAVLAISWIVAMLLNVALFAPVYWLLSKLQSKRDKKEARHEHDA